MWLPDAHAEAPAPMSALLSGVFISAGAYAILRLSFGMVFPAVGLTFGTDFVHALAIFGILSAFLGSMVALVSTDIKRLIAYSSIAHMGYIMFGLSLFPVAVASGNTILLASAAGIAIVGTVLHIVSHALSKGLLFLTAGGVMHQTEERDIRKMGGLAGKMPWTSCHLHYSCLKHRWGTTIRMLHQRVPNLHRRIPSHKHRLILHHTHSSNAHSHSAFTRLHAAVHFKRVPWSTQEEEATVEGAEGKEEKHGFEVPNYMKLSFAILAVLIIVVGIYPTFFIHLIQTVKFG